jgi:hypothetical protein
MSKSFWDHPIETIEKALHIRKQIEMLQATIGAIIGGDSTVTKRRGRPPKATLVDSATSKVDGRKGKRSAATIAKMKAAQQARWAKKNGASSAPDKSVSKGPKKRRKFSAESRAKMAAAQKARWAKKKIDADVTMPDKLVW